jgi:Na+-driven multidrug efflux pump
MSLGSPMSTFFTIRIGKPHIPMVLAGISALICTALCFLLVKPFGLAGAAIASTAGYAVGQTIAIISFIRITRVTPSSVLMPRWSDVTAYVLAGGSLLRRLRRAA